MKTVKLCKDCKWSKLAEDSSWDLRCNHPNVNANNSWVLGLGEATGTCCRMERDLGFFSFPPCGMAGKLWEPKP